MLIAHFLFRLNAKGGRQAGRDGGPSGAYDTRLQNLHGKTNKHGQVDVGLGICICVRNGEGVC